MDLPHGPRDEILRIDLAPRAEISTSEVIDTAASAVIAPMSLPVPGTPLGRQVTTPLLRQCVSLASRARVELVSGTRFPSAAALSQTVAALAAWEPSHVVDPDPTLVGLAIASLRDLVERLPGSALADMELAAVSALWLLEDLRDRGTIRTVS